MKNETKRQIIRGIVFTLVGILLTLNIVIWSNILNCDKKKKIEVVNSLTMQEHIK